MTISLKDIREAMSPLADVGKGELDFTLVDTLIVLRTLMPDEETDVQRFAQAALSEGDITDQITGLEYLDRFRKKSLAYSIVQFGDVNFRDVEYVETGEKLPSGQMIKVKRVDALFDQVLTRS